MVWQTEIPTVSGYYWIAHQNRDTWLDASIEVAYLYFDGKWSVLRPGEGKGCKVEEITHWMGPLDWPQDPYKVAE